MSQVVNERTPTYIELDAYNKSLKLLTYSMEVCKPKTKTKLGRGENGEEIKHTYESNHHIPARYQSMGNRLLDALLDMSSAILEANEIYVGPNISKEERQENYMERIYLQKKAIGDSFYAENIVRILHEHKPFADSTIGYWIKLLVEARKSTKAWYSKTRADACGV